MGESSVKSRIAMSMAEEMLKESGYQVFKPEYERVVGDLIKSKKIDRSYEKYITDINNHSNDLLVVGQYKQPAFIKLLYNEPRRKDCGNVIHISSIEPFVRVDSEFLNIPLNILIKYRDLVKMRLR